MARIIIDPDPTFEPDPVDVEATATSLGVGLDTAAVVTRRQSLETLAAAYRARTTTPPDTDVADLLDALIAAVFDA